MQTGKSGVPTNSPAFSGKSAYNLVGMLPAVRECEMGTQRGMRDGTGPFPGSYQSQVSGKAGKRQLAGEACPVDTKMVKALLAKQKAKAKAKKKK